MSIRLGGNNWATMLGEGLVSGAQSVAQRKLEELSKRSQQERTEKGLEAFPGLSEMQRKQFSMLDPRTLQLALQLTSKQQMGEQAGSNLMNILSSLGIGQNGENMPGSSNEASPNSSGPNPYIDPNQVLPVAKFAHEIQQGKRKEAQKEDFVARKENTPFKEELRKDIEFGTDIKRVLDNIEQSLGRGAKTGLIAANSPNFLLDEETQGIRRNLADLVTLSSQAKGQGRGSDLLRKMIKEGKISLDMDPAAIKNAIGEMRSALNFDESVLESADEIIQKNNGKEPKDLFKKARDLAIKKEHKFNRMTSLEKFKFLIDNPKERKDIRQFEYDGQIYVRDDNDNWELYNAKV